jgi:nicotinic acid phosphoribosyltransferase
MRLFHHATDEEIKSGLTTDVYFSRTKQIIEAKKLDRLNALAEVTSGKLPDGWPWGVLCGIEEVAHRLCSLTALTETIAYWRLLCWGLSVRLLERLAELLG